MLLLNVLIALLAVGLTDAAPLASDDAPPASASAGDDFQPAAAPRDWKSIVLHHSATSGGSVESIDRMHRLKKDESGRAWLGIGYHFVVGNGHAMGDGEVRSTFRWQKQLAGAHAGQKQYNETGIGICLIGNFDEAAPTARQVAAVRDLMILLGERYSIPRERMLRHLDVQSTLCPGRLFPWDKLLADLPQQLPGS